MTRPLVRLRTTGSLAREPQGVGLDGRRILTSKHHEPGFKASGIWAPEGQTAPGSGSTGTRNKAKDHWDLGPVSDHWGLSPGTTRIWAELLQDPGQQALETTRVWAQEPPGSELNCHKSLASRHQETGQRPLGSGLRNHKDLGQTATGSGPTSTKTTWIWAQEPEDLGPAGTGFLGQQQARDQ